MLRPTVINLCGLEHPERECDTYIGRRMPSHGLPQSKWANMHKITKEADRPAAIEAYRQDVLANPDLLMALGELQGERIGCWCHPKPCHGHVLAAFVEHLHRHPIPQLRHALEKELPANQTLRFLNGTGWFSKTLETWEDVPEVEAIRFLLREVRPKFEGPVLEQAALL